MPDDPSSAHRTPVPGLVEVLSVEAVEPIVTRHEEELAALRLELADAEREAEAAEQSLARHPAARVFDDAFEADVLAQVAESLSTVTAARPPATADPLAASRPAPPGDPGPLPPASDTPLQPVVEKPPGPGPGVESPARPRTTVVDRGSPGAPRTVVVDRGRPSPPPPLPPPPPAAGAPVLAGDPGAARFVNSQASAEVPAMPTRKRRGRKAKGHLLARLPARVLIQAGVVVVIVALLMLKLA